jgi:hypothetical protein
VLREESQVLGEETIPEEHRREESQDQEGNQGAQNVDHMVGNSLGMEEVVEDILEEVVGEHLEAAAAAVDLEDLDQAEARDETCSVDIAQLAIVLPGMAFEPQKNHMPESEGRQRKYPHGFALSEQVCEFTSEILHHVTGTGISPQLTPRIAGSLGTCGGFGSDSSFFSSATLMSFTSLPRKTMYS